MSKVFKRDPGEGFGNLIFNYEKETFEILHFKDGITFTMNSDTKEISITGPNVGELKVIENLYSYYREITGKYLNKFREDVSKDIETPEISILKKANRFLRFRITNLYLNNFIFDTSNEIFNLCFIFRNSVFKNFYLYYIGINTIDIEDIPKKFEEKFLFGKPGFYFKNYCKKRDFSRQYNFYCYKKIDKIYEKYSDLISSNIGLMKKFNSLKNYAKSDRLEKIENLEEDLKELFSSNLNKDLSNDLSLF